jgi:hypothetical protein
LTLLAPGAPSQATGEDRGSVGIFFAQLYDPQRLPSHFGPLVVLRVVEGSPAEKAGVHGGDLVIAVNGLAVGGRDFADILTKEIHGPVGGMLKLTFLRFDGSQSELSLVRAPYPPHLNPASDAFVYRVPGSWAADLRTPFPLPWAPALVYHGFVDLFFSPNFDDTTSAEYHSYLFYMLLEGQHLMSADQLQSFMLEYFRGLAVERGGSYGFTPDISKVSASYKDDSAAARTLGGEPARTLSGTVTIYDTHGKTITLNSEVLITDCRNSKNTIFFFGMSLEPRGGDMWKQIDEIRDTFRCNR